MVFRAIAWNRGRHIKGANAMKTHLRFWLTALAVLVGGVTAGSAPEKSEPKPGSIYGRTNPQWAEKAVREGGGTMESEAAVARGLRWLVQQQSPDGSWKLDGNFKDRRQANDTAGTAFGLLPFLGAGKTHKPAKNNPYGKTAQKGLDFLLSRQDGQTGNLGGGMYAHALATIALAEAYGLTKDRKLRKPVQLAVNYIARAQHSAGGWRYAPGQAGDLSVTGWQVMALFTARMSKDDLEVSNATLLKANTFLKSCCDNTNEGFGYVGPDNPTPTTSAVGLLCWQYFDTCTEKLASGDSIRGGNPLVKERLLKGIDDFLVRNPPGSMKNMYYHYYATQVMHHVGGERWKGWNKKMRDLLVKSQDKNEGPNFGSWSSAGDAHGPVGGRLMVTSLSLLTLEVYYRHVPLHGKVLLPDSKK
jgi:hypothetical protein